jgi:hypothetical protein
MTEQTYRERICKNCGWVHFAISRQDAEAEVASFNAFYDTAGDETRAMYSDRSTIDKYMRCFSCGGPHTNFRDSTPDDTAGLGWTIQPILTEDP